MFSVQVLRIYLELVFILQFAHPVRKENGFVALLYFDKLSNVPGFEGGVIFSFLLHVHLGAVYYLMWSLYFALVFITFHT